MPFTGLRWLWYVAFTFDFLTVSQIDFCSTCLVMSTGYKLKLTGGCSFLPTNFSLRWQFKKLSTTPIKKDFVYSNISCSSAIVGKISHVLLWAWSLNAHTLYCFTACTSSLVLNLIICIDFCPSLSVVLEYSVVGG